MAEARANTWAVEHSDAMQQKPGHFFYQEWIAVERGPQASRGPSTAEERAYAILLTRHLEKDPLSIDASAARAWLSTWWDQIPDIEVAPLQPGRCSQSRALRIWEGTVRADNLLVRCLHPGESGQTNRLECRVSCRHEWGAAGLRSNSEAEAVGELCVSRRSPPATGQRATGRYGGPHGSTTV